MNRGKGTNRKKYYDVLKDTFKQTKVRKFTCRILIFHLLKTNRIITFQLTTRRSPLASHFYINTTDSAWRAP